MMRSKLFPVVVAFLLTFNLSQPGFAVEAPQEASVEAQTENVEQANISKSDNVETIESIELAAPLSAPLSGGGSSDSEVLSVSQNLNVDPMSGSVASSIPIAVPAGRAGIQPNIQLLYSSSLPNDVLGVGWLLDLSSIQRSTKRGVPEYDNSDSFVLKQNGSDQKLVNIAGNLFAPETEGAFMKIEFVTGAYWRVTDKNGTAYYFGENPSSREYDPSDSGRVFKWCLNRVEDLHGNYMILDYIREDNRLYADTIDYTGNAGLSTFARVEFIYDNLRSDKPSNYIAGFKRITAKRLIGVNVKVEGQLQRSYMLQYTESSRTSRSMLTSVLRYGADGVTGLPPITLSYQDQEPAYAVPAYSSGTLPNFLGDFNGDGFTDIGGFNPVNGRVEVQLFDGQALGEPEIWAEPFGQGTSVFSSDFNGDGKTDIYSFNNSDGTWRIGLSDGSKFNDGGNWITGFGQDQQVSTGDFNGDGLNDIVTFFHLSGQIYARMAINKGGSFQVWTARDFLLGVYRGGEDIPFVVDSNADGLADFGIYTKTEGHWRFDINTGSLARDFEQLFFYISFGNTKDFVVADFNNDQLIDIGYYDDITGIIHYRLFNGTSFGLDTEHSFAFNLVEYPGLFIRTADFNGDGLTDFVAQALNGIFEAAYSGGNISDLLSSVNNGIGGITTITYDPSTHYANTALPFPVELVKTVTASTSLGDSYTTTYNYGGGLWDGPDREFRGFAETTVTDPEGNYSRTVFLQDDLYKGRILRQGSYDSLDNPFSKIEYTWNNEEIAPGSSFVYLERKDNFVYDGDSTGKRTAEEFFYEEVPELGNLTKVVQYGEVDIATGLDIPGDTRTVETAYVKNISSSSYLFGFPIWTVVKSNNGDIVRQTWFDYDNKHRGAAPDWGLLTLKEDTDFSGAGNPVTQYGYDSTGNLVLTTDSLGNVTTIAYDSIYNIFPLTITNALNHTVVNEYYGIDGVPLDGADGYAGLWGQLKSTTDPNQQVGKRSYNTLGDLIATVSPLDSIAFPTQTTDIEFFSDHVKTTQHQRIHHGQGETIEAVVFTDGLGRTIQAKTRSGNTGQYIVSGQAEYNSRGLPEKKYLNRFTSNGLDVIDPIDPATPHVTLTYDAMGRTVRTTNPDGSYSSAFYDDWVIEAVNENGHKQGSGFDAYGRLIEKREYLGADGRGAPTYPANPYTLYATTMYSYDSEGNLTQTQDAHNNITTITYDSLGRKTAMNDPDMGTWFYEYDLNGNLTKQTDAKSQVIDFTYDVLNRLVQKTDGGSLNVSYTYDDPFVTNSKGRLTQAQYSGGDTEFKYDSIGREIESVKKINNQSFGVQRNYDALNELLDIQYPDGEKIFYKYNPAGQIEAISNDPVLFEQQSKLIEDRGWKIENGRQISIFHSPSSIFSDLCSLFERHVLGVKEAYADTIELVTLEAEDMPIKTTGGPTTDGWNIWSNGYIEESGPLPESATYEFEIIAKGKYAGGAWPNMQLRIDQQVKSNTAVNTTGWASYFVEVDVSAGTHAVAVAFTNDYYNPPADRNLYVDKIIIREIVPSSLSAPVLNTPSAGNGQVDLSWSAVTSATGYKVKYGTASGNYGAPVDVGNTVNHAVTGLNNDVTYYFAVTAYNATQESPDSNEQSAAPAAPLPPGSGAGMITYEVWEGISGGSISDLTNNANYPDNPSQSAELTALEGWTDWNDYYGSRIRGYIHPPITENYYFWVAGDDNSELYLSTNDDPANKQLIATVPGWTSSRQWDKFPEQQAGPISLVAGQTYYIEVLQKEGSGGDNIAVAWESEAETVLFDIIDGQYLSPYSETGELSAPVLNAPVAGDGQVDLTWNAVSGATGYKVKFGTSSGNYGTPIDVGNVTNHTVTGLNNGITYYFVVMAYSAEQESDDSNEQSTAPVLPPLTVPALNAPTAGNGQVNLTWNTVTEATGYKVYFGAASGNYGTPVNVGNVTSYPVTGLTNDVTYYFVVTAYNAIQESAYSNEQSATPTAPPPVPLTAPVLDPAVAGDTEIDLTWSSVTDAAGYKIKYGTVSGGGSSGATNYTQDPDCVAAWKLDETSGTMMDACGSNHGTSSGTLGRGVAGQYDNAIEFYGYSGGGNNAYVNFGSATALDNLGTRTIVAWIRPDNLGSENHGIILSKDYQDGWELRLVSDNKIAFSQAFSGGVVTWTTTTNAIQLNTWQHIAVTYAGSGTGDVPAIYINGVSQAISGPTPYGTIDSDAPFSLLLGIAGTSYEFDGLIDEAAIFKRMLTVAEINDIKDNRLDGGLGGAVYENELDVGNVTGRTVSGLDNDTTYYFVVSAYNAVEEGPDSNEESATPVAGAADPQLFVSNVQYNAQGQVTQITYGNGTVTTNTYDPLSLRLTRIYTVDAQSAVIQDLNYTYDPAGNILSITDNVNSADQEFEYDELNRLVEAVGETYGTKSYQYDEIGNIISKDALLYTYGEGGAGPHALTSRTDGTTFTYDGNGNMATKQAPDLQLTEYIYDVENRLIEVKRMGLTIAQYTYDGDGGRTTKTTAGMTTKFIGSVYELNTASATRYVFFGGTRVASITNGRVMYYLGDHLGGANVLTDDDGFVKEITEYEPFGAYARHDKYGTDDEVARFYFTGQRKDDETGLYFYGARYYDPDIGRFITADTIVQAPSNPQTLNRYSYAGNNPVNNIDLDGHGWFKNFIKAVVGALVRAVVATVLPALIPVLEGANALIGAISGAIAGATTAAAFGGDIGIGAGIGFVAGGAFGTNGSNGVLGSMGPPIGLAILTGGLAYSASQDGWKGVGNFAAGVAGGVLGTVAGNTVGKVIAGTLQDPATATDAAKGQGDQQSQQQSKPNSQTVQEVNQQKSNPIAVVKGARQIQNNAENFQTVISEEYVIYRESLGLNAKGPYQILHETISSNGDTPFMFKLDVFREDLTVAAKSLMKVPMGYQRTGHTVLGDKSIGLINGFQYREQTRTFEYGPEKPNIYIIRE